jgi:hypothetical protein
MVDLSQYLPAWDWASMGKTVVGSGIGTGIVSWAMAQWRERNQRRRVAAPLAARLAVIFESYAATCVEFVAINHNLVEPQGEEFPRWNTALPRPREFPEDAEGSRALDRNLVAQCLSFQTLLDEPQSVVSVTAEYSIDDLRDELDERSASAGLEACRLAALLRKKNKVGKANPTWDYEQSLRETFAKATASLDESAKSQGMVLSSLTS